VEGGRDLKLGMTVDVKIVVAHKEKVLVIPRRLVAVGGGETVVSVLGPRGPEPRRITVGLWDDARVEVVNGLALGDRVLAQRPSRP
jgi:hypothetical protein